MVVYLQYRVNGDEVIFWPTFVGVGHEHDDEHYDNEHVDSGQIPKVGLMWGQLLLAGVVLGRRQSQYQRLPLRDETRVFLSLFLIQQAL